MANTAAILRKQWAMKFPQYAVSKWMGHSTTVSGRHCANDVLDELFDKAAKLAAGEATEQARRNAQQKVHEGGRNDKKRKTAAGIADSRNSSSFGNLPDISGIPAHDQKWSRGDSNPRPLAENTEKTDPCERGAPLCAPPVAPAGPGNLQLAELIDAWSSLPASVRRGIMAMVQEMRRE